MISPPSSLATSGSQQFTYDAAGRLTKSQGYAKQGYPFAAKWTEYKYDLLNDPTSVTDVYSFDPSACVAPNCPPGMVVRYPKWTREYDMFGHLTASVSATSGRTSYTYDENSNLKTVTDALNRVSRFSYTPDNQVETITNPLSEVTGYAYNTASAVEGITDPLGHLTAYAQNSLGALAQLTSPIRAAQPRPITPMACPM